MRKSLIGTVFILSCLGSDCSARQPKPASPGTDSRVESTQEIDIEQLLLAEMNRLRAEPESFISVLKEYRSHFKGKKVFRPGEITLVTNEGVSAVDDAIDFLESAEPLPALRLSAGMSKAAAVHVEDLGPKGKYGHYGTDGSSPSDRLKRYGQPKVGTAENLGFGEPDGHRMVLMLLIDDGVPG
ncbi:MAG: CAP domain-containing protein, partial [Deltaproteobacteria bacterium]|nr:CAP domain-containing protein [Deltaproteobacteria bacterium]